MNLQSLKSQVEQPTEQIPQISIGEQLNVMSELKRIDYQNSLVMKSLELYNKRFEQLRIEQIELLNQQRTETQGLKQIVINLDNSNKLLKESLSQELSSMSGNIDKLYGDKIRELNKTTGQHQENLKKVTEEYIKQLETLKTDSKKRFDSYFYRWKIVDILVYINLAITPLLVIYISYLTFFKK